MSREGGNVRVVPEGACGGVQNRPPRTKPPSQYRIILRRAWKEGEGQNRPPGSRSPSAALVEASKALVFVPLEGGNVAGGWKCSRCA